MKPIPLANADTEAYWKGAAENKLLYQVCGGCSHTLSYPRGVCPRCHSDNLVWHESTGRGTVVTFSIVHRAPTPAFKDDVPYVLALVDFEEGFRLMMNVLGANADSTAIGDAVEVTFEARGHDGHKLPQVQRAG